MVCRAVEGRAHSSVIILGTGSLYLYMTVHFMCSIRRRKMEHTRGVCAVRSVCGADTLKGRSMLIDQAQDLYWSDTT